MVILSKLTFAWIFGIFIVYSLITATLVTLFGTSYFLVQPMITEYIVTDNDFNEVSSHVHTLKPVYHKITPILNNDTVISREDKRSSYKEQWQPPQVNATYVSVSDGEALYFHCNVCAVVTNSGQLLGKGAGSQIDLSDCIFRMNYAPTLGFETDVGRRTDVRVIGHSNLMKDKIINNETLINALFSTNIEGKPSTVLVPWLFRKELNQTEDLSYVMANNLSKRYSDVRFYVSTPEWVDWSEDFFRIETGVTRAEANTWLSTGWMTILFAIDACATVNVYGMVQEQHCMKTLKTDVPYHYYEDGINAPRECQYYIKSESNLRYGHKLITEKAVFARWATRNDLNFYYPEWKNISGADSSTQLDTLFLQLYKNEPFRKRLFRRKKLLNLRAKFKTRYAKKKKIKVIYTHKANRRLGY